MQEHGDKLSDLSSSIIEMPTLSPVFEDVGVHLDGYAAEVNAAGGFGHSVPTNEVDEDEDEDDEDNDDDDDDATASDAADSNPIREAVLAGASIEAVQSILSSYPPASIREWMLGGTVSSTAAAMPGGDGEDDRRAQLSFAAATEKTEEEMEQEETYPASASASAVEGVDFEETNVGAGGGGTPLHVACRLVLPDAVLLALAEAGGPECVSAQDEEGDTALHCALRYGASEDAVSGMIRVLLLSPSQSPSSDAGALYLPDKSDGDLPLHCAVRHSAPLGTIRALLEAGPAAVAALNGEGGTALHVAVRCDAGYDVVALLVEAAAAWFRGGGRATDKETASLSTTFAPWAAAQPPLCGVGLRGEAAAAAGALRAWTSWSDLGGTSPAGVVWEKYVVATFGSDSACCETVPHLVVDNSEDDEDAVAAGGITYREIDAMNYEADSAPNHDIDEGALAEGAGAKGDACSEPGELWETFVLLLATAHYGCVLPAEVRHDPAVLVASAVGLAVRGQCPTDALELVVLCHASALWTPDGQGRLPLHHAVDAVVGGRGAAKAAVAGAVGATAGSVPSHSRVCERRRSSSGDDDGLGDLSLVGDEVLPDKNARVQPVRLAKPKYSTLKYPCGPTRSPNEGEYDGFSPPPQPPPPPPPLPLVLSPVGAAVRVLLAAYPHAAAHADGDGRLPLHLAVAGGLGLDYSSTSLGHRPSRGWEKRTPPLSWQEDGVEDLFRAHPDAIETGDAVTGLAPFMLAAASFARAAEEEEEEDAAASVDAAFQLLVRAPWLVAGDRISSGPMENGRESRKRSRLHHVPSHSFPEVHDAFAGPLLKKRRSLA